MHYIAESRRQELLDHLRNAIFFSILLDGSADKGNIDSELILVVRCDVNGTDERAHQNGLFQSQPASVCVRRRPHWTRTTIVGN